MLRWSPSISLICGDCLKYWKKIKNRLCMLICEQSLIFLRFLFFVSPQKNTIIPIVQNKRSFQLQPSSLKPNFWLIFFSYLKTKNNGWVLNRGNMVDAETIRILTHKILQWWRRNCARVHYLDGGNFLLKQMLTFFIRHGWNCPISWRHTLH